MTHFGRFLPPSAKKIAYIRYGRGPKMANYGVKWPEIASGGLGIRVNWAKNGPG